MPTRALSSLSIVKTEVACEAPASPPFEKFVNDRSTVSSNSTVVSPRISIGTVWLVWPTPKLIVIGPAVKSPPVVAVLPVNTMSTEVAMDVTSERVTVTTFVVLATSPSTSENVAAEKSYFGTPARNTTSLPSPPWYEMVANMPDPRKSVLKTSPSANPLNPKPPTPNVTASLVVSLSMMTNS